MPRAGLTPDAVVTRAAEVADAGGFDAMTLAAVAKRCDVALPSLYKHVGGLDDLRRRLAVRATNELTDALRDAAIGKSGDDALRAVAQVYRDYATRFPGRYAATVRAPEPADTDHQAAATATVRVVFAVLAGYGIEDDEAVHATRALRSALHGFVALESAGGFGLPQDVDASFNRLVDMFATAFSAA